MMSTTRPPPAGYRPDPNWPTGFVAPRGRCRCCGDVVQPDHRSGGRWGHTIAVPVHVCGGDPDVCSSRCPDAEPQSCGPIELEA